MKKILFLYTSLADYFLNCLKTLAATEKYEIHLVRWPIKAEAPFKFEIPESITLYERSALDDRALLALSQTINPQLIFCSGWQDRGYVKVAKEFRRKIPVITSMDNHWFGTPRQYLARIISPFTIRRYFNHIWVPGAPQSAYAKKLGFGDEQVSTGLYVADEERFGEIYGRRGAAQRTGPKTLLYVGRYVRHKGVLDLWKAFVEFKKENDNDWQLLCMGTGELWNQRIEHEAITHAGFVQPQQMSDYIQNANAFILPSHFEPWGVVVHEMALAGLPLLCSDAIGAASYFLRERKNGFSFAAGDRDAIKRTLLQLAQSDDHSLESMGAYSNQLGHTLTPAMWVETLEKVLERR